MFESPPSFWEHVLAALLGLVIPVTTVLRHRGESEPPDEEPATYTTADKIALYWSNGATLAVLAALVLWASLGAGRDASELGLTTALRQPAIGFALVAVLLGLYAIDTRRQLAPDRIDRTRRRWHRDTPFMPTNAREVRHSLAMVTSAAIFEEILFRGFLIGYVSTWTPASWTGLALAVALPSVVFSLCHSYQGARAMLKIAALSGLCGAIFVATGSLCFPIVAHFTIDLVGVMLGPRLMRAESPA